MRRAVEQEGLVCEGLAKPNSRRIGELSGSAFPVSRENLRMFAVIEGSIANAAKAEACQWSLW